MLLFVDVVRKSLQLAQVPPPAARAMTAVPASAP